MGLQVQSQKPSTYDESNEEHQRRRISDEWIRLLWLLQRNHDWGRPRRREGLDPRNSMNGYQTSGNLHFGLLWKFKFEIFGSNCVYYKMQIQWMDGILSLDVNWASMVTTVFLSDMLTHLEGPSFIFYDPKQTSKLCKGY